MKVSISTIVSIFVLGLIANLRSVHLGSPDTSLRLSDSNSSISTQVLSEGVQAISGVLLRGPDQTTRNTRARMMQENEIYIKGWLYDLTDKQAKKFLKSQSREIPIEMIMENKKYQQYGNDFQKRQDDFTGHNITLYPDQKMGVNFTHAKTFVGDRVRIIQTANLTHSSLYKNIEHFFIGTDRQIRDDLLALRKLDQETILHNGKKNKKGYTDRIQDASPNLVVCPLNCRTIIENLITNAHTSIRISQQYITDDALLDILYRQQDKDIRIITNDMPSNYPLSELLGKEIVSLRKKPYSHDKMMIIDNQILLVGSMNFSANALDNNREIGILTTDPQLVRQAGEWFE